MNKKSGVIALIGTVAVIGGIALLSSDRFFVADSSSVASVQVHAEADTGQSPVPVHISTEEWTAEWKSHPRVKIIVDYADGVSSLAEMRAASDLIVTGIATGQRQAHVFGVVSTVKVTGRYQGQSADVIEIVQAGKVGDSEILTPGQEYILFLGLQGKEEENQYFIKGGPQGAFENSGGELSNHDAIMRKSFRELLVKTKTKSGTDYGTLVHWLETNRTYSQLFSANEKTDVR